MRKVFLSNLESVKNKKFFHHDKRDFFCIHNFFAQKKVYIELNFFYFHFKCNSNVHELLFYDERERRHTEK